MYLVLFDYTPVDESELALHAGTAKLNNLSHLFSSFFGAKSDRFQLAVACSFVRSFFGSIVGDLVTKTQEQGGWFEGSQHDLLLSRRHRFRYDIAFILEPRAQGKIRTRARLAGTVPHMSDRRPRNKTAN
jgi:hypothetical protein